jgi:polyisoprenoid-binding protein YceI
MTLAYKTAAVAAAAALAAAASVHAQAFSDNPAAVQPGAYTLETSHARVLFALSHLGFSTWYGDFTGAKGTLKLDPKTAAASQLEVTIPAASVLTTNTTLDDELKSPAWLDVAQYPTITFRSTKVTSTGPRTAQVAGDLTFHGVTKPVVLDAKFSGGGADPLSKAYTVGFEVSGKIKRSDFGVKNYVPMIGDEVTLIISAPFQKTPG